MEHAVTTTDFYREYSNKISIENFPVIDKHTINTQLDSFLSNKYNKDELVTMKTSGSTGTPFTSYQNKEKKKRVHAEIIYYTGKAGYSVGRKLVYMRAITSKNKKSELKQWIQNETLINTNNLDEKNIQHIISTIQNKVGKDGALLLGYPSTYQAILNNIGKDNNKDDFNVYGIVSSSELLHDELREQLSETINCDCYSRYANEENGLLGQDSPEHPNTFIINEAHYHIEVLKMNSDVIAEEGEVGRIVVTDLYNYAMPMIRYDTGDIRTINYIEVNGMRKRAITNFSGRKIDSIFDTKGNRISPYAINNNFALFPQVIQYQFVQEGKNNYRVKLITDKQTQFQEKEMYILLKEILGDEALIRFEYVNEIPRLSSGKFRYIKNVWLK